MRTFILIGRNRKTGKSDLICDDTVPIVEQLATRKNLAQSRVNDEFSSVRLIEVHDSKSKLKFITTEQHKASQELQKAATTPTDKADQGPTLEEYIKAGYAEENYPPQGYNAKPSPAWDALKAKREADAASAAEEAKRLEEAQKVKATETETVSDTPTTSETETVSKNKTKPKSK